MPHGARSDQSGRPTSAGVPVPPHAGCGRGGGRGYRVAGRTVHESAVGSCPVTRAVEAPGLHRNHVVTRQGFVQAALVGRFTGKAERIEMNAIGSDTELRLMVRNELHELPVTLFHMVEIGLVERTDLLARLRRVGHPPRPIEATHEVVYIVKVDHG